MARDDANPAVAGMTPGAEGEENHAAIREKLTKLSALRESVLRKQKQQHGSGAADADAGDQGEGGGLAEHAEDQRLRSLLRAHLHAYAYSSRGLRVPHRALGKITAAAAAAPVMQQHDDGDGDDVCMDEVEGGAEDKEGEDDGEFLVVKSSAKEFLKQRSQRIAKMATDRSAELSHLLGLDEDSEDDDEDDNTNTNKAQQHQGGDGDGGQMRQAGRQIQTPQTQASSQREASLKKEDQQPDDFNLHPIPDDVRMRALIEKKGLGLVDLQRRIRASLFNEGQLMSLDGCRANHILDHSLLKRLRQDIGSLTVDQRNGQVTSAHVAAVEAAAMAASRAAKAEERAAAAAATQQRQLEAQRIAAEERMRRQEAFERARQNHESKIRVLQARKKFLQELTNHREDLRKSLLVESRKMRKQRCENIIGWHSKERRKKIREANARVLALKSDNIEEYLKMAKEAKNTRVSTLLEKTEGVLVELGMKVADQRAETGIAGDDLGVEDFVFTGQEKEGEEDVADSLITGQKRYLSLVHSKQEEVEEQPSLLINGQLRQYQLEGLQWMVSLYVNGLNGILADEMGLGKTIQTVALFAYLMEKKGNFGPHLVICPKAVLSNWANEMAKWLPNANLILYDGAPGERKALREERMAAQTFNVLLTHYDMIMRDKKTLKAFDWEYIIIDEGHRLKNKDSKLSEVLRGLYKCRNRLLLTGTPIQNNLKELWALLNFVLPKIFDTSDSFDDWFAAPFKGAQEDIALAEEEELLIIHRLHQIIRPFLLRRKKSEVEKELPSKSEVMLKCDLSAWQKTYYKQITGSGSVMLETPKGMGRSRTLMNSAMQLRKACIHPYLFLDSMYPPYQPDDPEELVRASGKFELLDRVLPKLKAAGHRVLLFSQMTRAMDLLEHYLEMRDYNYLRLDGETKTHERPLLLAEFNAPGSDVFLFMLSTRAGGLGLNLQTADTVILFDSDWNPQMDKQAEDRAHRIGQKREVKIITLVTVGSIEEVILERARQKADIDNKVIQAGMFNQTSSHHERHETLSAIFQKGIQDIGRGVSSDEEINELLTRSKEEEVLFAEMDRERLSRSQGQHVTPLMSESEVPEWAVAPPEEEEEKEDVPLGPRKAKSKQVVYNDGLTDRMWSRLIDDGMDLEEITEQGIKRTKRQREQQQQQQQQGGSSSKRKSNGPSGRRRRPVVNEENDDGDDDAGDIADDDANGT